MSPAHGHAVMLDDSGRATHLDLALIFLLFLLSFLIRFFRHFSRILEAEYQRGSSLYTMNGGEMDGVRRTGTRKGRSRECTPVYAQKQGMRTSRVVE